MSEIQLPSHLSKPPTGPFEVLIPENWALSEPPKFGGKVVSFLAASLQDTNEIEFDMGGRFARSSDPKLQEYLNSLASDGQLCRAIQHCCAMMHSSAEGGSIGWFGAVQQEWAYTFHVFELGAVPNQKWEVRRKLRLVQRQAADPQVADSSLIGRIKSLFTRK
jgi:hypothetical protein